MLHRFVKFLVSRAGGARPASESGRYRCTDLSFMHEADAGSTMSLLETGDGAGRSETRFRKRALQVHGFVVVHEAGAGGTMGSLETGDGAGRSEARFRKRALQVHGFAVVHEADAGGTMGSLETGDGAGRSEARFGKRALQEVRAASSSDSGWPNGVKARLREGWRQDAARPASESGRYRCMDLASCLKLTLHSQEWLCYWRRG